MAVKRMFSSFVVGTDLFLEMPASSQALYFHLGMAGDDDGFVSSPKKIMRGVGCNDDDLRLLAAKGYIIPFQSGVIVITDWKLNNVLKNDRYNETLCLAEKNLLSVDSSGRYVLSSDGLTQENQLGTNLEPTWNQLGTNLEPQHNVTQPNKTKHNQAEQNQVFCAADKPPKQKTLPPPSLDEVRDYCEAHSISVNPEIFWNFYQARGWMTGKTKMVDWHSCLQTWALNELKKQQSLPADDWEEITKHIGKG